MKLVTWNCAMALAKKHQELVRLDADVTVIQECSQLCIEQIGRSKGRSFLWFGDNPNKGLAVLVRAPWIIREAQALKPKWTAKLVIDGPASIELFPVWACKSKNPDAEYIEQIHLLLDVIEEAPLPPFAIVVGDFNSNSMWDSEYGSKNHSAAVDRFRKVGLESAYHKFFEERQGAEQKKTHWNRKRRDAAYHIDYAFLSQPLLSKLKRVAVGTCDDWLPVSDHAPVLIEVDL